jgi:hypothetical protein
MVADRPEDGITFRSPGQQIDTRTPEGRKWSIRPAVVVVVQAMYRMQRSSDVACHLAKHAIVALRHLDFGVSRHTVFSGAEH